MEAGLPVPVGDVVDDFGVVGDDADGDVVVGVLAADGGGGLVVAEEDDDGVVGGVAADEAGDGAERVLDGVPVGGAGAGVVAEEFGGGGLLEGGVVEDGAVADLVPGDEARDFGPGGVA